MCICTIEKIFLKWLRKKCMRNVIFFVSVVEQKRDSSGLDLIKEMHFLEGRGSGLTEHL